MNSKEAKEILALFRPGTADEGDPDFIPALQLAKQEPELERWFNEHCASYLALRQKFQQIPVPPALQEQILSERTIRRPFFQRYWAPILAAAAVVALLVNIEFGPWPIHSPANDHSKYLNRMVSMALRTYGMQLKTDDPAQIQSFLAEKHAPSEYTLPAGLKKAEVVGCVVTRWQGAPVSMICFKTGRPLQSGDQADLWLFIAARAAVANSPPPGPPVFTSVNKTITASWTDNGKTYALSVVGDELLLKKYLQ